MHDQKETKIYLNIVILFQTSFLNSHLNKFLQMGLNVLERIISRHNRLQFLVPLQTHLNLYHYQLKELVPLQFQNPQAS